MEVLLNFSKIAESIKYQKSFKLEAKKNPFFESKFDVLGL